MSNGKGDKSRTVDIKKYCKNYDVIFNSESQSKMKSEGPIGLRGKYGTWKDLAPDICRQRMVIEGTLYNSFKSDGQVRFCKEISKVLNMTPVDEPRTSFAEEYGWCCFMHWKESGMHIYSWDHKDPKFFSIDIYTCKKFDPQHVVNYTREFFGEDLINVAWKD